MDSFLKDIRYGVRSLMKRPTLTIIAIITLAIGIGANSAIFSAVNAMLIKPLRFPEPDRIRHYLGNAASRGVVHNEAPWPISSIGVRKIKHSRKWVSIAGGAPTSPAGHP